MSTPDKTHDSGDVPETDFGKKEQSRLAELLGDECKRKCLTCEGVIEIYSNTKPVRCRSCDGRGFHSSVPTGLALIEACRKRGLRFIAASWPGGRYIIECFNPGSSIRFEMSCQFEDLESAISIAALKGLESVADPESAN